jgi:hypothetical protein
MPLWTTSGKYKYPCAQWPRAHRFLRGRLLQSWSELQEFKIVGVNIGREIHHIYCKNRNLWPTAITNIRIPFTFRSEGINFINVLFYKSRDTLKNVVLERVPGASPFAPAFHFTPMPADINHSFESFEVIDGSPRSEPGSLSVDLTLYDLFDQFSALKSSITHLNLSFRAYIDLSLLSTFASLSTLTLQPEAATFTRPPRVIDWMDQLEEILVAPGRVIKIVHISERSFSSAHRGPGLPPWSCLTEQSCRRTMDLLGINWDWTMEGSGQLVTARTV